jgi:hypothetical protein
MARDAEQPPDRRAAPRIELLAALERSRERLGDEIQDQIRLRADPAT